MTIVGLLAVAGQIAMMSGPIVAAVYLAVQLVVRHPGSENLPVR